MTRREIQIVADLRLIAMSLKTMFGQDPHKAPARAAMDRIIGDTERVILSGPANFHQICETALSATEIERDLRRSTFGQERV